jgi:cbb3-type cytochrome oxidase subunit 1
MPPVLSCGGFWVADSDYNYQVVRQFSIMTVVWGVVGMLVIAMALLIAACSTR